MRVAHLSDLHLGMRAYPRTEGGWNLRERDVASAFQNALLAVVRLRPQVVVLSGDLFHDPDPPSTAFLSLIRGIDTLRQGLPDAPILAIAGGHDSPAPEVEPGPVAVLDALPGVVAAAVSPRSVHLEALDLHALLVPHRAARTAPWPELRPDPSARWNLLVVRGMTVPPGGAGDGLVIDPSPWDWVAVGGAHGGGSPAPRVRVAGSLERTGVDPWEMQAAETGFGIADLALGSWDFHALPARPVVDLAPVVVDPDDPGAGSRRLRDLLEGLPGGIDGKLLRVRLQGDVIRADEAIEPGLLQAIRARTAHVEFRLEAVSEEVEVEDPRVGGPVELAWSRRGREGGRLTLSPGVWAFTASSDADRMALARALHGLEADGMPAPAARTRPSTGEFGFRWMGAAREDGAPPEPSPPEPSSLQPSSTAPSTGVEATEPGRGGDGPNPDDRSALRAEWVERAGEVEAHSLEWVRDRQAAESRLESCRERAHELRSRIRQLREEGPDARCPTCRRPLAEAHPDLVQTLEEEWEAVVQDGTWWRRRREQLEDKPAELRELEREVLRLQARLQEPGGQGSPGERVGRGGEAQGESGQRGQAGGAAESGRPRWDRRVLREAGSLLHRATGGRLAGLASGEAWARGEDSFEAADGAGASEPLVVPEGGAPGPAGPGDRTLVSAALVVARWQVGTAGGAQDGPGGGDGAGDGARARDGEGPGTGEEAESGAGGRGRGLLRVLPSPHEGGGGRQGDAARFLELVAARCREGRVVVVTVVPPGLAGRVSDDLAGILELRRDASGGVRFRLHPGGPPRLVWSPSR